MSHEMILVMLSVFLLTFFLAAVARQWKFRSLSVKQLQRRCSKLPKGAWCLPWIGESIQFFLQSPYHFHDKHVSKYGGIFRSHLLGYPAIVTSTEEAAGFVLSTQQKSFKLYFPIVGQFLGVDTMKEGLFKTLRKSLDIQTFPKSQLRSRKDYVTSIDSIARWALGTWDTQSRIRTAEETRKFTFHVMAEHQRIRMAKTSIEEPLCCSDLDMMPLTWRVIQETLRLANIVPQTIRSIVEDVNFKGTLFPKGWKVYVSFLGIHLSPKNYKDPLKFDPSRFEASETKSVPYIPFGLGNHMCSGRLLVKLESMIFIHYLVNTYSWEVIKTEKIQYWPAQRPSGLECKISKLGTS
ncbi:hypothetical protein O6H91_15G003500 [Diphasiastrum complanatum]|uniref:Uncharacterized protein n=1 Tax=Diphasiastrum complanatum TaxID=34168 RepID=A0ACC2BFF8_DIPCM|nr:hypothetical protein O6H91_15G003500 [Diphasiastrum complanatum]